MGVHRHARLAVLVIASALAASDGHAQAPGHTVQVVRGGDRGFRVVVA